MSTPNAFSFVHNASASRSQTEGYVSAAIIHSAAYIVRGTPAGARRLVISAAAEAQTARSSGPSRLPTENSSSSSNRMASVSGAAVAV